MIQLNGLFNLLNQVEHPVGNSILIRNQENNIYFFIYLKIM